MDSSSQQCVGLKNHVVTSYLNCFDGQLDLILRYIFLAPLKVLKGYTSPSPPRISMLNIPNSLSYRAGG